MMKTNFIIILAIKKIITNLAIKNKISSQKNKKIKFEMKKFIFNDENLFHHNFNDEIIYFIIICSENFYFRVTIFFNYFFMMKLIFHH